MFNEEEAFVSPDADVFGRESINLSSFIPILPLRETSHRQ